MPKLYIATSPSYMAYVLDGGGSGCSHVPPGRSWMETEYIAIMYGLNEYFLRWNREELDARQDDLDMETREFYRVATPSQQTPRPLPAPVQVCMENEIVMRQLRREYHIASPALRKLAQQIWQMTEKVPVQYEWVSRKQNLARRAL